MEGTRILPVPRMTEARVFVEPDADDAGEQHVGVGEGLIEHGVAAAKQLVDRCAESEEQHREDARAERADDHRMQCQRLRPRLIARAHRPADGGGDAAAHRARRQHLLQHPHREHQRHGGERRRAELSNIGRLRDRHQRDSDHGDHVRQGEPSERRQDRRGQQRIGERMRSGSASAVCGMVWTVMGLSLRRWRAMWVAGDASRATGRSLIG